MEKIGGSISYQLIDIFNILEDKSLSEEEKRNKIQEYQKSLTQEGTGVLINKNRENGQCMKNGFFVFGDISVMSYEDLVKTKKHVDKNLSSFTCEAEMKMSATIRNYDSQDKKMNYDFSLADKVYNYAMSHGKDMRGHTIVWHKHEPAVLDEYIKANYAGDYDKEKDERSPDFISKRAELTKAFLSEYTQKIGERYPNIYCWDVFNEIVPQMEITNSKEKSCPSPEEREDGLRHSKWFEYLGKDYYIDVLKIARKNLPEGTKLFYNEFGEQYPEKRKAMLNVIKKIKEYEKANPEEGILLDGIGLQSHYDLNMNKKQIKNIYKDFGKVAKKYGLEIQVTEMDIAPGRDEYGNPIQYNPDDMSKHNEIWNAVIENANKVGVKAFTGWGINDSLSWYPNIDGTMVKHNGEPKDVFYSLTKEQSKGNRLTNFFSKIASRFGKRETKVLLEAKSVNEPVELNDEKKENFLEDLRMTQEEVDENVMNYHNEQDKKKELGLEEKKDKENAVKEDINNKETI